MEGIDLHYALPSHQPNFTTAEGVVFLEEDIRRKRMRMQYGCCIYIYYQGLLDAVLLLIKSLIVWNSIEPISVIYNILSYPIRKQSK